MPQLITRFWWVRHGPTRNPDGLVCGRLDLPFLAIPDQSSMWLAGVLPAAGAWVTTPLKRTMGTAQAILRASASNISAIAIPELLEQSFGQWEGQPAEAVYGAMGPDDSFWHAADGGTPPGGESFAQVMARTAEAIDDLADRYSGCDVVVVGHAGPIRAAVAVALDLAPRVALRLSVEPLSVTRLDRVDGIGGAAWRVGFVNRTAPG